MLASELSLISLFRIGILASAFGLLALDKIVAAETVPAVTDTRSIVLIWGQDDETQSRVALGSGFVIGASGRVVTARHVVDTARRSGRSLWVSVGTKSGFPVAADPADVKCADEPTDLCVIRISPATLVDKAVTSFYRLRCYVPPLDAELRGVGFPGGSDPLAEIIQPTGRVTGSPMQQHLLPSTVGFVPTMSGGPVFDVEQKVVGIAKGKGSEATLTLITLLQDASSVLLDAGAHCDVSDEHADPMLFIFGRVLRNTAYTPDEKLNGVSFGPAGQPLAEPVLDKVLEALASTRKSFSFDRYVDIEFRVTAEGELTFWASGASGYAPLDARYLTITKFSPAATIDDVRRALITAREDAERAVPRQSQRAPIDPFTLLDMDRLAATTLARRVGAYGVNIVIPGFEFTWTICEVTVARDFRCLGSRREPVALTRGGSEVVSLARPFRIRVHATARFRVAVCSAAGSSRIKSSARALSWALAKANGHPTHRLEIVENERFCGDRLDFAEAKTDSSESPVGYQIHVSESPP